MNVSIVTKIPSQYQKQFIRHIPILSVSRQLKVSKKPTEQATMSSETRETWFIISPEMSIVLISISRTRARDRAVCNPALFLTVYRKRLQIYTVSHPIKNIDWGASRRK